MSAGQILLHLFWLMMGVVFLVAGLAWMSLIGERRDRRSDDDN